MLLEKSGKRKFCLKISAVMSQNIIEVLRWSQMRFRTAVFN